jgi:hypothetical protein
MSKAPKYFTCPRCKHRYLGHDPLPDCPQCGYDYRATGGFRWDVVFYLLAILGLVSFLLVASFYRRSLESRSPTPLSAGEAGDRDGEKLPGAGAGGVRPFQSPYHEQGK